MKEQEFATIVYENEEKTLKISYFGIDEVFIQSKSGTVSVHLGDIEWLIWQLQNI
jgi:hypothetical protein